MEPNIQPIRIGLYAKLNKPSPHKQLTGHEEAHSEWNYIGFQRGTVVLFIQRVLSWRKRTATFIHGSKHDGFQAQPLTASQNALYNREETNWTSRAARNNCVQENPLLGETDGTYQM